MPAGLQSRPMNSPAAYRARRTSASDFVPLRGLHYHVHRWGETALATPAVLATGDQVECGHTAIIVSISASADPSPTKRL